MIPTCVYCRCCGHQHWGGPCPCGCREPGTSQTTAEPLVGQDRPAAESLAKSSASSSAAALTEALDRHELRVASVAGQLGHVPFAEIAPARASLERAIEGALKEAKEAGFAERLGAERQSPTSASDAGGGVSDREALRQVCHALGVCYCWDYGCEPGPLNEVLARIRELTSREGECIDAEADRAAREADRAEIATLRGALAQVDGHWAEYADGEFGPDDPEGVEIIARVHFLTTGKPTCKWCGHEESDHAENKPECELCSCDGFEAVAALAAKEPR
jgi:hypothetical protein